MKKIKIAFAIYTVSKVLKTEIPAWSSLSSFIPCIRHSSGLLPCLLNIPQIFHFPPSSAPPCSPGHCRSLPPVSLLQAILPWPMTFLTQELSYLNNPSLLSASRSAYLPSLTGCFLVRPLPTAHLVSQQAGRSLTATFTLHLPDFLLQVWA